MSDARLRELEREWGSGEHEAGARLFVELLRRDLPLPAPDREAWTALWRHVPPEVDPLRGLERAWRAGSAVAGAQLVVERLRRGPALAPSDREGWEEMWEYERVQDAQPAWRSAFLVAGCSPAPTETMWLARVDGGDWLRLRGDASCPYCSGRWSCYGEATGAASTLEGLVDLLQPDEVTGLLAVPGPTARRGRRRSERRTPRRGRA